MKLSDMPIRDFYALEIIKGIVARDQTHHPTTQVSQAYDVADALLKFQAGENALRDHEMAALRKRAEEAERTLEILRPAWAQGWTSDSVAAQASATALGEIWNLIGVKDQTAAMARLRGVFP